MSKGWGVVWVEMGEYSVFLTFEVKSAVFSCFSRAGVVLKGVWGLYTMRDGICEEKIAIFGESSLVV